MALKQQLHQRQVQRLILAPALQQAIKLLPLTNLELIEIIDAELSQNPMLETQEEEAPEKQQEEKEKENQAEAAESSLHTRPQWHIWRSSAQCVGRQVAGSVRSSQSDTGSSQPWLS